MAAGTVQSRGDREQTSRGFAPDFQRLRHTRLAVLVRACAYRAVAGREGWPLVFRAPASPAEHPRGVSANLYVHLPFCQSICPHCPYNKVLDDGRLHDAYRGALMREVDAYAALADVPAVESLYFGGGTPSATPDLIALAVARLRPLLAPGAEVGVEVHPRDASLTLLTALADMGVNRVSLGIETLRPDLLRVLGRRYSPDQALEGIRAARAARMDCVDVNLIYGIPGQVPQETADDAARCIALGVDQISAYPLFTFTHTPLGRRVSDGRCPPYPDRARLRAQALVSRTCRERGLARTSVWSFTRPGVAPYSTVTHEDYVGFGAGAGSKVAGSFWFNTFSVPAYIQQPVPRPALCMSASARFQRVHWLYWQIYRTEIDAGRYASTFGRSLSRDFGRFLWPLAALGMARPSRGGWQITELGAVWVHRLQSLFSLTYIDDLWERCRGEAWPEQVVLE